jgi:predicted acyltransferase
MRTPEAQAPQTQRTRDNERLVSLDVFRGLTVAAMILVTDPGTYSARYWPLCHSEWNGPTPTDMIFPAFLFAIGMAMTFSFATRLQGGAGRGSLLVHVLVRSILLIVLGLLVNGFPDYHLHTLRLPGILQHIALTYLAGSLIYLAVDRVSRAHRVMAIAVIAVALLALHWALLKLAPVPGFGAGRLDSLGNLGAYIDRSVFGVRHLWAYGTTPGYGVTFDPDGLLLTITSLANLFFGCLAGEWLRTRYSPLKKLAALVLAGVALVAIGHALNPWMPLNKKMWTSTFAILSSGESLLMFAASYFIVDLRQWRFWTIPSRVFGKNAILAFAISSVITTLADRIHVSPALTLHQWGYQYGFATWMQPINASLAYAVLIVLLNLAVLYPFYRKRIFLRI